MVASVEDRFGKYPDFLLMRPHCLATFSDPRFSWIYFSKKPEIEDIQETVTEWAKEEIVLNCDDAQNHTSAESSSQPNDVDSFWGKFDTERAQTQTEQSSSFDSEIHQWSGLSAPSRSANPVHVMDGLKRDYPRIFMLFRKFSIYPATQNKDERLFSMIGRTTGALSRNIRVETIEKKVVVGSAIQKHGFIFHYKNGVESDSNDGDNSS